MMEKKMKYEIRDAIATAEPFDYRDESLEAKMMGCYSDDFELGDFSSDKEATEAAIALQEKADEAAARILNAERPDSCLEGGPCYAACLWKVGEDGEDDTKIEN